MFLSGLKEKSIVRKIKAAARKRGYQGATGAIKSAALLQDEQHPFATAHIPALLEVLGIEAAQLKILTFVENPTKDLIANDAMVVKKHLGWKGALKPLHLKSFASKPYDVLLSYYEVDHLVMHTLTALSSAKFKVGIGVDTFELNDLSIRSSEGQEEVFVRELEKYLKILKITK